MILSAGRRKFNHLFLSAHEIFLDLHLKEFTTYLESNSTQRLFQLSLEAISIATIKPVSLPSKAKMIPMLIEKIVQAQLVDNEAEKLHEKKKKWKGVGVDL